MPVNAEGGSDGEVSVAPPVGTIRTESGRPAAFETYWARRRVRVVGVLESELDTLATLNAEAAVWLSVATALASLAAGIRISAAFVDKLNSEGTVLKAVVAPVLFWVAAVFLGMSVLAWWRRRKTVRRIFEQSIEAPPP